MNKKFIRIDSEEAERLSNVLLNLNEEYEIFKTIEYKLLNELQKASAYKEFTIVVEDCTLKITVTENHIFVTFFSEKNYVRWKTDIRRKDGYIKLNKKKKYEVK